MPLKSKIIGIFIMIGLFLLTPAAHAKLVFNNEFLLEYTGSNKWTIDALNMTTGDIQWQFGNSLTPADNGVWTWDITNKQFEVSHNISLENNKLLGVEIEPVSALPGGAGGLGAAGEGRIVVLNTQDQIAPGCTLSPYCGAGTYVWNGSTWISLTGTTSSNFNKLITVGSSGADYTTIASGASYLQTLSGGIMLLAAETHAVTTAVNMTNIIMIGKDSTRTTVQISGSGQLDSFDTTFEYLTLDVNAMTDDMAIDVQSGSNALLFNYVDINVQDAGDSLIDSNAGTAPTTNMKFIKSNESGGSGTVLKTKAAGNLNTASAIYIDSRSSDLPLQMSDWNVTLAGGGSVNTSGTISSVPAQSIFVSPNMNLQGAIDSIEAAGSGGLITLLPGTYPISSPLTINDDEIQIVGYGDASVISASGFTGGSTVAAIIVGATNGTDPVNNIVLKDFRLEVTGTGGSDIHGIRVVGGENNRVDNVTVQKVSGASGTGAGARVGIQMTDAAVGCAGTCVLTRPVIIKARVLGSSSASAYFTDGIHVTSDSSYPGVSGNNQGVINALVDGNFVDYVRETGYAFAGTDESSLFNNRSYRMGVGGTGAFGIFVGNSRNLNMSANVFTASLSTTAVAIGIEPFNIGSLKQTSDSIFSGNVIDGMTDGGVGFGTGFRIGNASNTGVHRNTFEANTIRGASNDTTVAVELRGNADDNEFSDHLVSGGANAWDTGFSLGSATAERNILAGNRFENTTAKFSDSGSYTLIGTDHHRAAANPTANDDNTLGYQVGSLWINTSANTSYVLVNNATGAAVWNRIDATGSTPDFEAVYTQDADKTLTTSNGAFTLAAGSGAVNLNSTNAAGVSINNNVNGQINLGTGTSTGAISIGGGSNTVAVNSTSWDISTAGVASGFTGFTSTGTINFSGASRFAMQSGAANPGTCTEGDLFYNTADNFTYTCTAANTWNSLQPDSATFTDTTPANFADNDTTELYNEATAPNITTDSTSSAVLVSFNVQGAANDSDDETYVVSVVRDNGGNNPDCGVDTQVGILSSHFKTAAGVWSASGMFLDAPGVAGNIRYNVCTSSATTFAGDLDTGVTAVNMTLVEIGN